MTLKRFILPLPWLAIAAIFVGLALVNLIQWSSYKSSEDHTILSEHSCTIKAVDEERGDTGTLTLQCGDELTLEASAPEEYLSIIREMQATTEPQTITCRKRRGNLTQSVDYWCGLEQEDS